MKKTKKLSIIAAASAIALGVSTFGTAANAADYKITFIQGVAGDAFYVTMGCGVAAAAAKDGATITTQGGAKWDATIQTPVLNSVVASKPDAILIAPNDMTALQKPIEAAIAAGIKQAGMSGKVKIVGFDAGSDQVAALKAGTVQALIAQQPATIGSTGVDNAVAALKGTTVSPHKVQTGFTILTMKNINTAAGVAAQYRDKC